MATAQFLMSEKKTQFLGQMSKQLPQVEEMLIVDGSVLEGVIAYIEVAIA